ncbi:MAG TPA: hypothetical protein VN914_14070 [Polyangia bacterium]|nr:hypothetical protein [Polyangia bacterium]
MRYHIEAMKLTNVRVAAFLMNLGAVVVFSQATSFAWWNKWSPVSHFINLHALLLAATAVSLLCSSVVIRSLTRRIEKLEAIVSAQQRD